MAKALLRIGILKSLGANYLWGLANFTFGAAAGGIFVAIALLPYVADG